MSNNSYIPSNLIYYFRPETKEYEIKGYPVWPIDASKSKKAAENWSKNNIQRIEPLRIKNDPLEKIQLLDFEMIGEKNHAWKICFDLQGKNVLANLESAALLEVIKGPGIAKNGILEGQYQWISDFGLKLVLIGGENHTKALQHVIPHQPKLSGGFQIGGIYQSASKEEFCYLGLIDSEEFILHKEVYNSFKKVYEPGKHEIKPIRAQQLWLRNPQWIENKEFVWSELENLLPLIAKKHWRYLEHVKKKSLISKLDLVPLPSNHLELIKNNLPFFYPDTTYESTNVWLKLIRPCGQPRPNIPIYDKIFQAVELDSK